MSDTIRIVGFEGDVTAVAMITPTVIQDDTPVESAAIDRRVYRRRRALLMAQYNEVGATTHTMAFTATESATEGGAYTACTTSGTLTATSADAIQFASIKPNFAKPWLKITATGSHTDVDGIASASVLFIGDSL
jgi:hypothetical protein